MTDNLIKKEIRQMRCVVKETENLDDEWLSTNEWVEAVSDFEIFSEQLQQVIDDPRRWKWAVIVLHSGIQGMMILALKGSDRLNVLRCDFKLNGFLELYKKIKSDSMKMYLNSQKFVPKGTQGWSIKELNRLRNDFVHFTPKLWRLESGGLPDIILDCLEIAEFLAWESGNVIWDEHDLKKRLGDAFKSARKFLCALQQKGLDGF